MKSNKRSRARSSPAEDPLATGRGLLDRGDARGAIDALRRARHASPGHLGLAPLLYCAFIERARQLTGAGNPSEAAGLRRRAEDVLPEVDFRTLAGPDLERILSCLPFPDAVRTFADLLPAREEMPGAERRLASRLVVVRSFDALDALPADHPLRLDAPSVRAALPAMDAGAWSAAGDALSAVARRSPYAPWRVFCRAMVCWESGDQEGLRRAVSMLPEGFPLRGVLAEWRQRLEGSDRPRKASDPVRAVLWEGRPDLEDLARALVDAVQLGKSAAIGTCASEFSRAVCPEDPASAAETVLLALALSVATGGLQGSVLTHTGRRLLPSSGRVDLVVGKAGLVALDRGVHGWDPVGGTVYLRKVADEFPDPARQSLARACVLEHLARSAHQSGLSRGAFFDPDVPGAVARLSGTASAPSDPAEYPLAFMRAALRADPGNRDGYLFLLDLIRGRASSRSEAEEPLLEMARRFPGDAAPCLELASLYHEKGAHRKAERALEEAVRRAPHDETVLDREAAGLAVSSDRNRNRGKFDLAWKDLDRAFAMGRRRLAPVLFVKRQALTLLQNGEGGLPEVQRAFAGLPPADGLRALAVLRLDLGRRTRARGLSQAVDRLLAGQNGLIAGLTSAEALGVIVPVHEICAPLFTGTSLLPVLGPCREKLFERLSGDDLLAGLDLLFASGMTAEARKELDRRLKEVSGKRGAAPKPRRDPLLLFYLAVARFEDGLDKGTKRFQEAIRRAGPDQEERLRAAASRLAPCVDDPLRGALERFDFDILDASPLLNALAGLDGFSSFNELVSALVDDEEEDEDEDEDWDCEDETAVRDEGDELPATPEELVENLELLVDVERLRGAPLKRIQTFARRLWADPAIHGVMQAARRLHPSGKGLSREVFAILSAGPPGPANPQQGRHPASNQLPLPF